MSIINKKQVTFIMFILLNFTYWSQQRTKMKLSKIFFQAQAYGIHVSIQCESYVYWDKLNFVQLLHTHWIYYSVD